LSGLWDLCQSAGCALPYENICFVSDRHEALHFDEQGRLHCETGPAIKYRDGFCIHMWHGTRIPSEWIDAAPDAKTAITWPNIEQRRAAIEIVGWSRILSELGAETIDADGDPQIGTLVQVQLPDLPQRSRFIQVQCGTGRQFAVCVPPHVGSAIEAQAWMQGLPANQFQKPEIRT
jgi:hypothetical protein